MWCYCPLLIAPFSILSMDAYSNEKAKELKLLNLKRRQSKLGEMLAEERRLYEVVQFINSSEIIPSPTHNLIHSQYITIIRESNVILVFFIVLTYTKMKCNCKFVVMFFPFFFVPEIIGDVCKKDNKNLHDINKCQEFYLSQMSISLRSWRRNNF